MEDFLEHIGDALTFKFDHLVLALGSITRMPDIAGLSEHRYGLKSMSDAMALRDRAIQILEMANLSPSHKQRRSCITFAIVGAGYMGVEAAGEFNSFLREALREYPHCCDNHGPQLRYNLRPSISKSNAACSATGSLCNCRNAGMAHIASTIRRSVSGEGFSM